MLKGCLVCLGIAVPAYILGNFFPVIGGPVFAILLGMCIGRLIKDQSSYEKGIKFVSKKVLQLAVILLGFGLNLRNILEVGAQSMPVIISTISVSLIVSYILSKALKIPAKTGILVGVGSSICGGSAIAATAPVIKADEEEIAQAISVIFLFNVIAALIFPTLGDIMGLSNEGFGLFAGTAVNDTSSVTAAASAWDGMHGSNTLAIATVVKLTRTLAIIPITFVLAIVEAKKSKEKKKMGNVFPMFILFFLLASVITTVFHLDGTIVHVLKTMSKFCIILAMAAIGINTDVVKLLKTGKKPILLGFVCWVAIALVSIAIQMALHLN
ncbi:putative integral membrane protein (TIGR00698 family) [Aequitasia blattaphilus]|uniref:YeiH family protein n=1 Tax=Aequitasia blattaphilus TaxID=2949332 RepID=A0ABT1E7W4_9FIRM|nr:YeiH family protein [Aequitasia blattaphilus]MCP1101801.1 YeiH family protein [Aequitasia blattaphilus]MCR8614441.1 YeiH family protein [Aequitasia blattaphilus]